MRVEIFFTIFVLLIGAFVTGPLMLAIYVDDLDARVAALEARVTVPGSTDIPRKDQTRMEVTP